MTNLRHINVVDTAKLVRARLKDEFPGAEFRVRSRRHAGGAAMSVVWTDGPIAADVKAITSQYEAARFDGMIDMKVEQDHFLLPDGSVQIRYAGGTETNLGTLQTVDNRRMDNELPPGVERVRFGADHITLCRQISDREMRQAHTERWVYENCEVEMAGEVRDPKVDRVDAIQVVHVADRLLRHQKEGEDLPTAYRRAYGRPPKQGAKAAA